MLLKKSGKGLKSDVCGKGHKRENLLFFICIVSLISAFLFCLFNILLLLDILLVDAFNNTIFVSDIFVVVGTNNQLSGFVNVGVSIASAVGVLMILRHNVRGLIIYIVSKVVFVANVLLLNRGGEEYTLSFLFSFSNLLLISLIMVLLFLILTQRTQIIVDEEIP